MQAKRRNDYDGIRGKMVKTFLGEWVMNKESKSVHNYGRVLSCRLNLSYVK